jgi:hypothetical protein
MQIINIFMMNLKVHFVLKVDEIYRNCWSKIDLTKHRNRLILGVYM